MTTAVYRRTRRHYQKTLFAKRHFWAKHPENLPGLRKFLAYYKQQNLISDHDAESYLDAIKKRPPISFRVNSTMKPLSSFLQHRIDSNHFSIKSDDFENMHSPKRVKWAKGMYTVNISKTELRDTDGTNEFRLMLKREQSANTIRRQDLASSLAVQLLNVKPYHRVLEMCAAPGSKSTQILEALHTDENSEYVSNPEGLLVSNDAKMKRIGKLKVALRDSNSPNYLISCVFGQRMPFLNKKGSDKSLNFSRVLCDVPCSGDATSAKRRDQWVNWNAGFSSLLFERQCGILERGFQLLQTHGRLVYSTCSLNPLENEAVIAKIMNKYPGQMVLEDPNLDGLDFRSGVSHWYGIDENTQPPDNAKDLHLDKCVRIFPQDIESCGFFVAIISRKPKPTNILEDFNPQPVKQKSIDPELCEKIDDEKIEFDNGKEKQVWRGKVKSESLETPSQADSSIKTFPVYSSLANDRYESVRSELTVFGSNLPWTQLVHRGLKNDKKIYMVSENVASIITHQDNKMLKFIHSGVKAFDIYRQAGSHISPWVITQEAASILVPFLSNSLRLHAVNLEEYRNLLQGKFPDREYSPGCNIFQLKERCIFSETRKFNALSAWIDTSGKSHLLTREQETAYLLYHLKSENFQKWL